MSPYNTCQVDAHRPAQDNADKSLLPQTVFYHPDWAYSSIATGSRILREKKTQQFVTWLPAKFFDGVQS